MTIPQRTIEHLLLVTRASRAMYQLRCDAGNFAIEAEAVQHDQPQLRHRKGRSNEALLHAADLPASEDVLEDAPEPAKSGPTAITARLRAPLLHQGNLVGVISLHWCRAHVPWSGQPHDALAQARRALRTVESGEAPSESLRTAAIQAVLDQLRTALDVQRCTFRQPVEEAYAFPVTFESRANDQRSLLGDFTIVQTGQPVIVKLLAERAQVIQEDCRIASKDPLFHKMLEHYGGMRAQMVTPFIVGDLLKGVLSVHELRAVRAWTAREKALAAQAAALIGALTQVPDAHQAHQPPSTGMITPVTAAASSDAR